jgi:hypothetical protein
VSTLRVWVGRTDSLVFPHMHRCRCLEFVL